jgi:hypothetical protein
MNISRDNISGECNYKCDYSFNYQKSNSTAINKGSHLILTYETFPTPPVVFNYEKYNIQDISLYAQSFNTYNGSPASGELAILHTPINGGIDLVVIVPITTSGTTTKSSQILTEIINMVSVGAPAENDQTNQGIPEFSLNELIPKKPFYTYKIEANYIVFGIQDSITLDPTVFAKLANCIPGDNTAIINTMRNTTTNSKLIINSSGPSMLTTGDGTNDIYIDCKPTGNSEENQEVVNVKSDVVNDFQDVLSNPTFLMILSLIISVFFILVILFSSHYGLNYIASRK